MGKPTRRTKNEPLGCKYLLQFDGVLQRFPSITQANSQIQPASKLSYLGERSESRKNAQASVLARLALLAQIGELARRLPRYVLTNLSFCYPENLSIIFELFQYDELRYYPESIFQWKKKKFSVHEKCPNFSMLLCLRTRGKLMLANFRLKVRAF